MRTSVPKSHTVLALMAYLGLKGIVHRGHHRFALQRIDLAVTEINIDLSGRFIVAAMLSKARGPPSTGPPSPSAQARAIADVPLPIILQDAEQIAEVVAIGTREHRSVHVQGHPVHDMFVADRPAWVCQRWRRPSCTTSMVSRVSGMVSRRRHSA